MSKADDEIMLNMKKQKIMKKKMQKNVSIPFTQTHTLTDTSKWLKPNTHIA